MPSVITMSSPGLGAAVFTGAPGLEDAAMFGDPADSAPSPLLGFLVLGGGVIAAGVLLWTNTRERARTHRPKTFRPRPSPYRRQRRVDNG